MSIQVEIKILFMTGYSGGVHESALEGGATLLKKPFTVDAILEKVASVLEGVPERPGPHGKTSNTDS